MQVSKPGTCANGRCKSVRHIRTPPSLRFQSVSLRLRIVDIEEAQTVGDGIVVFPAHGGIDADCRLAALVAAHAQVGRSIATV